MKYDDQRVTNLLAMVPETVGAATYYVVGAHYDTVPSTPGADDNASAVAVIYLVGTTTMRSGLSGSGLPNLIFSLSLRRRDRSQLQRSQI